ncbi:MAG: hypothetical protein LBU74_05065 [Methanobacteriaceae archaeon]|nr:hypothetical protein [Candidatus Methanorudis spinitermitis]
MRKKINSKQQDFVALTYCSRNYNHKTHGGSPGYQTGVFRNSGYYPPSD